jgi:hypothetical protein
VDTTTDDLQKKGGAVHLPRESTHAEPRRRIPQAAKCPCEEREMSPSGGNRLCGKESISMTALGKLLCKEHTEEYEMKWNLNLNRLQLMA